MRKPVFYSDGFLGFSRVDVWRGGEVTRRALQRGFERAGAGRNGRNAFVPFCPFFSREGGREKGEKGETVCCGRVALRRIFLVGMDISLVERAWVSILRSALVFSELFRK